MTMLSSSRYCVLASTFSPHRDRFLPSPPQPGPTTVEAIALAASVGGLAGIELIHPAQVTRENLDDVRGALSMHGTLCASVAVSISSRWEYVGGALTSDDPEIRSRALQTVKEGMELAESLGAGRINLWLGREGFDYAFQIDYERAWARIVEALREACAHRPAIRIGIEYKPFEPRKRLLVSTAAKALLLRQAVGAESLGVLLDTGHALYGQESLAEVVAMLAREGALTHVHFNDNYRLADDDLIVGAAGFLETMEMLYWLDRVGYAGWLSFDPHPVLEDPVQAVAEGLRFARGLLRLMERLGREAIERAIATHRVTEMMALVNRELFGESG